MVTKPNETKQDEGLSQVWWKQKKELKIRRNYFMHYQRKSRDFLGIVWPAIGKTYI